MLSHLRFHRRGASNPTSPNPDRDRDPSVSNPSSASRWDPAASPQPQQPPLLYEPPFNSDHTNSHTHNDAFGRPHSSSNASSLPPILPPITRVTSSDSDTAILDFPSFDTFSAPEPAESKTSRQPPPARPYHDDPDRGFMGGVALQKYRREQQQKLHQQPVTARKPSDTDTLSSAPSFATPTDLQHQSRQSKQQEQQQQQQQSSQQPSATNGNGRRPANSRLAVEPATSASQLSPTVPHEITPVAAPKGRKGLPFLKNPMSTLLLRRKANQNAPDVTPLPLHSTLDHPSYEYDPRIRGTRVHDFSAPRLTRKPVPSPRPPEPPDSHSRSHSHSHNHGHDNSERLPLPKAFSHDTLVPGHRADRTRNTSNASDSGRQSTSFGTTSQLLSDASSNISPQKSHERKGSSNLDSKPLPGEPPSVPPKDQTATPSGRQSSTSTSTATSTPVAQDAASALEKSRASTRTTPSRNASGAGVATNNLPPSIPRHMKSTSSRFSFDMIGAARQEKLLEDRHRQQAMERQTSDTEPNRNPTRDSRFDDFDDDDDAAAFDYDAMMDDDDGLEERIPGVNADYDDLEEPIPGVNVGYGDLEEPIPGVNVNYDGLVDVKKRHVVTDPAPERDPDDDQENFAGFVFQRSNGASPLTSPRDAVCVVTPRDAEGNVIGYATCDDTPHLQLPTFHNRHTEETTPTAKSPPGSDAPVTDLAIQGLGIRHDANVSSFTTTDQNSRVPTTHDESQSSYPPRTGREDDMYYDGGLLDDVDEFAGEGDGSTFDESLFDLDDTDRYGRPIPGAFAAAKAARAAAALAAAAAAAAEEQGKRSSDSTSRMSTQSETAPPSTAHTSVSIGLQPALAIVEAKRGSKSESKSESESDSRSRLQSQPSIVSADRDKVAAYQAALAAAAHQAAASGKFRRDSSPPPGELSTSSTQQPTQPRDATEDSGFESFDDFGDDECSHLDDYGFDDDAIIAEANADALANDSDGWYGTEFGFYSSAPVPPRHSRDSSSGSDRPPFEYANGGFFGPAGVSRTKSGRVVSREPNLTPITERSEYSNRNSVMSLAVPPLGSSASGLTSPGLAQLAMMSDGDDSNMSLSALMRLRSKAWGGSQASLTSSKEGSPRSERGDGAGSPWNLGAPFAHGHGHGHGYGHARKNSALSIQSRDYDSSDAGSGSASPTMTMAAPCSVSYLGSPSSQAVTAPSLLPCMVPLSPLGFPAPVGTFSSTVYSESTLELEDKDDGSHDVTRRRPGMGHGHKGSAESVSYVTEKGGGWRRGEVDCGKTVHG
ncbi:hypothetical protein SODALDRAFT_330170 [Sodiomyces alkalinus F11]|uniref:AGC-kinase C-terminal domain-containing protein n=1 Tax=Sodiomyces alkalinus (strain CBS 110278 / VKM F-3762 / F11) TaxID=1314773 RepID=A0A3N2Q112_SODAK|nr:hypothetical protein SODALDRAFT_330170 [Sodiomyces alkalinus F11]ROT40453.1 hypothetical protein SODALDRAFT_330170 [Sodiomyces alkalinus F11]